LVANCNLPESQSVSDGICIMLDDVYIQLSYRYFCGHYAVCSDVFLCRRFLWMKWNQRWMRLCATEKQSQHVLLVSETIHDACIIAYYGHWDLSAAFSQIVGQFLCYLWAWLMSWLIATCVLSATYLIVILTRSSATAEIAQVTGHSHYAIWGHSRSLISVPVESPYATYH